MILYDFLDVCETVRFDVIEEPYKQRVRNNKLSSKTYTDMVIREAIDKIDSNDDSEIEKALVNDRFNLRNRVFELMLIDFLDILDSNWRDKEIEIIAISEYLGESDFRYYYKDSYKLAFPLNSDANYDNKLNNVSDIRHFIPLLIPKVNRIDKLIDHFANFLLLTICIIRIDKVAYVNDIMKSSLKNVLDERVENVVDFDNTEIKQLALELEFYTKDKFDVMCKIKKGIFEW